MRIEVIETPEALRKVREDWQAVFMADASAQYFLSWSWLYRYLSHRRRWFILGLRHSEPGSPYVAFFPLRLQTQRDDKGQFVDEIIMAGNYSADYTGFICMPEYEKHAVRGFSDFLKAQNWQQFKLDYFGGPTERREAMIRALQGPKVMHRDHKPRNEQNVDNTVCPVINLPDSWDDYLERHMSSQSRQKLRRFMRKVEGSDEYRITLADHDTIKRDLDILFDFWRKRWEPSKGDKTEKLIKSSREMLMDCFDEGDLDVPVLWYGDRPLGALANIVDRQKKAILFYITGRDEEWTTPSPGLVLHGYCIRRAIADGFRTYDFLRGTEPYKYMFGVEDRQISCTLFRTRDGANLGGKLNSRSVRFVYDQAVFFYNEGKKVEAEMAFQQVLATMPEHRGAQFGLANLQFERGHLKQAEEVYRSLIGRVATPVPIMLRLGDVELATRRYRQAAKTFGDICLLARGHVEARYKRGVALIALSRMRDASAVLSEAAAMRGSDPVSGFYADKAQKALLRLGSTAAAEPLMA